MENKEGSRRRFFQNGQIVACIEGESEKIVFIHEPEYIFSIPNISIILKLANEYSYTIISNCGNVRRVGGAIAIYSKQNIRHDAMRKSW